MNECENHRKYHFGLFYLNHIHGIGTALDIAAFFDAMERVVKCEVQDYPTLHKLKRKPVYDQEMFLLFEEAIEMQAKMENILITKRILDELNLPNDSTKLKVDVRNLASLFKTVFQVLTCDAPEFIQLDVDVYGLDWLEGRSVRIGPIEPIIISDMFDRLPPAAFEVSGPPLWLRDDIFDENFFIGKV